LPDGLFSNQKSQNLGGSGYGKSRVYFMTIWSILWPFGIFYGHLVYFAVIWYTYLSPFWYFGPRKIWQPWSVDGSHFFQTAFRGAKGGWALSGAPRWRQLPSHRSKRTREP
jgi:hypothetical protein